MSIRRSNPESDARQYMPDDSSKGCRWAPDVSKDANSCRLSADAVHGRSHGWRGDQMVDTPENFGPASRLSVFMRNDDLAFDL